MAATDEDLISVIVADHREVERLFGELEGTGDPQNRRDLADKLIAELVRHSVAEEMYMYPEAREVLADGEKVADHEIDEHAEVERTMKALEGLDASDPDFEELLSKLMTDVRHHVQDEESDLLPRMQAACSGDDLLRLGRLVLTAKASAPTRPHPSAPDKPPANLILAPGAGMIDRLRDALTGRTTS